MTTATAQPISTRKERWAWYMYDFGNSAYAAVVLLAVYSAYFQGEVVGGAEGSRLWGLAVGIAMLVVAVTSPVLGAIADFSGSKKKFLLFYTAMACLFTAALFFAEAGRVAIGMGFFILAEIGYLSAQVFYNGLLPEIAAPEEVGRISGNGWAIGTAGGVVCLLIILPLVVAIKGTFIVRLSLVITAVFFALSTIPLFLWLPERAKAKALPAGENYLSVAFKQLAKTIRTAGQFKDFVKFV
ncbi:MAG: MFS transporter, partial [Anaerolineae bacterium]